MRMPVLNNEPSKSIDPQNFIYPEQLIELKNELYNEEHSEKQVKLKYSQSEPSFHGKKEIASLYKEDPFNNTQIKYQ